MAISVTFTGSWQILTRDAMAFVPSEEDKRLAMLVILAMSKGNRTPAQQLSWITAGVNVAVTP